jgi:LuxR family transcriptional regulator, maltose regulon positive regulatory protein
MVLTAFSAPAHAVDRPQLRRQLDKALARPLSLVVAPAGAGKTVLLAQWVATHPELDFVWLEVVLDDNDPVRFSQRLLRGFTAINPDFADLIPLVSMNGGGIGMPLLEAFEAQLTQLPEVVVILDDLHHLSNSVLLADLGRLVDRLPPNVHLVLSTRADLPIAWSRLLLAHDVIEIRESDLALDEVDSALLLKHITGRSLGSDSVSNLVVRTEGWAAGLQLAGMTLRLYEDTDEFITQFSGDDRLIADYLSHEVLDAQPNDRYELLLKISVLDGMCAELVGHMTGIRNGQFVLDDLERQSMFLIALDRHRQWFRFHHLFRDMLRFKLRAEQPGTEERLLNDAASWHLGRGEVNTGVEYLLRAGNWDGALDVIMGQGSEVFERGEMATVIRWITAVPESARTGRQEVNLLLGILRGIEGNAATAEDVLGRVATDPSSSAAQRACAQVFLASLVQWRPRPDVSVDMAVRALRQLVHLGPAPMPVILNLTHPQSLETVTLISGGRAHLQAGDYRQARQWIDRGLTSPGATYPIWKVSGLGSLALIEAWCGNTGFAAALSEEALAIAKEVELLAHPSAADAYLASALAALERGEPRNASLSLYEGSMRAEANRRSQLSWFSHFATALLQEADGHPELSMATSIAPRSDLGAPPPPVVASRLRALHCRLLRLGGSPDRAQRTLDRAGSLSATLAFEGVATALTLGQHDLAQKLLNALYDLPDTAEPRGIVNGLVLRSWLADIQGSVDESTAHLGEALVVAERYSLIEVFVRAGPSIVRLVSEQVADHSSTRDKVLRRAHEIALPNPGANLIDPLTDRELEILSYLPTRLTNTELADQFYVSVNTIKTHVAHIFRKLDVVSRSAAISQARELGIL